MLYLTNLVSNAQSARGQRLHPIPGRECAGDQRQCSPNGKEHTPQNGMALAPKVPLSGGGALGDGDGMSPQDGRCPYEGDLRDLPAPRSR